MTTHEANIYDKPRCRMDFHRNERSSKTKTPVGIPTAISASVQQEEGKEEEVVYGWDKVADEQNVCMLIVVNCDDTWSH